MKPRSACGRTLPAVKWLLGKPLDFSHKLDRVGVGIYAIWASAAAALLTVIIFVHALQLADEAEMRINRDALAMLAVSDPLDVCVNVSSKFSGTIYQSYPALSCFNDSDWSLEPSFYLQEDNVSSILAMLDACNVVVDLYTAQDLPSFVDGQPSTLRTFDFCKLTRAAQGDVNASNTTLQQWMKQGCGSEGKRIKWALIEKSYLCPRCAPGSYVSRYYRPDTKPLLTSSDLWWKDSVLLDDLTGRNPEQYYATVNAVLMQGQTNRVLTGKWSTPFSTGQNRSIVSFWQIIYGMPIPPTKAIWVSLNQTQETAACLYKYTQQENTTIKFPPGCDQVILEPLGPGNVFECLDAVDNTKRNIYEGHKQTISNHLNLTFAGRRMRYTDVIVIYTGTLTAAIEAGVAFISMLVIVLIVRLYAVVRQLYLLWLKPQAL